MFFRSILLNRFGIYLWIMDSAELLINYEPSVGQNEPNPFKSSAPQSAFHLDQFSVILYKMSSVIFFSEIRLLPNSTFLECKIPFYLERSSKRVDDHSCLWNLASKWNCQISFIYRFYLLSDYIICLLVQYKWREVIERSRDRARSRHRDREGTTVQASLSKLLCNVSFNFICRSVIYILLFFHSFIPILNLGFSINNYYRFSNNWS